MRSLAAFVVAIALVAGASEAPPEARPIAAGLDHVPIAVQDLERAAERYRALGFALKPGRSHANGIRNQHVKFTDGTEIELITAPRASDALTAAYRRHLERGDGPAFLAFYAPGASGAPAGLAPEDVPDYIFFGQRNRSPTDRREHFAHANTAESLIGVWLAGDLARERALLAKLGATFGSRALLMHVPEPVNADVATIGQGEVLLLPAAFQVVPGRPIAGMTISVRNLATARRILEGAAVAHVARGSSLFLAPGATHGFWLELREVG